MGNDLVNISDCNLSFDSISNEPYYLKKLKRKQKRSNVLLLPHLERGEYLYPEFTDDIFNYICRKEKVRPLIIVSNENYKKIEKHCDLVVLGTFLCTTFIFPFLVNLLSNYLYDKFKSENRDDLGEAEVTFIVEDKNKNKIKKVTYKGPAAKMDQTIKEAVKDIFDEK